MAPLKGIAEAEVVRSRNEVVSGMGEMQKIMPRFQLCSDFFGFLVDIEFYMFKLHLAVEKNVRTTNIWLFHVYHAI